MIMKIEPEMSLWDRVQSSPSLYTPLVVDIDFYFWLYLNNAIF